MTEPAQARPGLRLWALIGPELRVPVWPLLALSAVAGLANTAILAVLGTVGQSGSEPALRNLVILLAAIAVYAGCQIHVARVTAMEVEGVLSRLRLGLLEKLSRTDLATFERLGRARLVASLSGDVQSISASAVPIVSAAQAALQLLFAVIYLFMLSKLAFVLGTIGVTLAAVAYIRRLKVMGAKLALSAGKDQEALEGIEDALRGAGQVKQNSARSAALRDHVAALSTRAATARREAQEGIGSMTLFGQMMFFLLLGMMVWVLPAWGLAGPTVAKAAMVLLFVLGAIGSLLQGVTTVAIAETAAARLLDLRAELARLPPEPPPRDAPPPPFESLQLRHVVYRHAGEGDAPGFGIGPIDLDLRRGEIVFLSGGNGAGKSTLIKVLAGLYPAQGGVVALNGTDLPPGDVSLRRVMAVVHSDFHLAARLWGVPPSEAPRVRLLLRELGLDAKVTLRDGAFSTVDLSVGQRKRLALIVALLERRPVLVLDEFAADQDPDFRRRFYREILPAMKADGLTVLAVTHDDDHFDACDRRLVMEDGVLRPA
ncbi:ATP-binding cassette domain-containing protein [Roseomonas sp. CECT 9278]|uniref:ATP-binding cassette domain-containing protein n=1 Tax=Roseomonas sp. CECT 9278 TaxID=2845823 RepID=UPI001E54B060|nr:ATP-binding cassette domain-containing protein [Roseomonas sp. CECT 9278]CAH0159742.1 ABC transporter ATP-binding/permease protein YojI [Roseomonas sp. CECT 9278]